MSKWDDLEQSFLDEQKMLRQKNEAAERAKVAQLIKWKAAVQTSANRPFSQVRSGGSFDFCIKKGAYFEFNTDIQSYSHIFDSVCLMTMIYKYKYNYAYMKGEEEKRLSIYIYIDTDDIRNESGYKEFGYLEYIKKIDNYNSVFNNYYKGDFVGDKDRGYHLHYNKIGSEFDTEKLLVDTMIKVSHNNHS